MRFILTYIIEFIFFMNQTLNNIIYTLLYKNKIVEDFFLIIYFWLKTVIYWIDVFNPYKLKVYIIKIDFSMINLYNLT